MWKMWERPKKINDETKEDVTTSKSTRLKKLPTKNIKIFLYVK